MNVGELKKVLETVDDSDEVCVKVLGLLTANSARPIQDAVDGFDWDSGKFVLIPKERLELRKALGKVTKSFLV